MCLLDLSLSLVLVLVFGVDQMYVLYVFAFFKCTVPVLSRTSSSSSSSRPSSFFKGFIYTVDCFFLFAVHIMA